jgi:hypothetical protein
MLKVAGGFEVLLADWIDPCRQCSLRDLLGQYNQRRITFHSYFLSTS